MKRSVITLISVLLAVSGAMAQAGKEEKQPNKEAGKERRTERLALKKLEGSKISTIALNSFKVDFPGASGVNWKRNGTFDEAAFKMDGKQMTAFYDFEGKLVGTTAQASWKDLPVKAQNEIKTRYKDYTVGPIVFFDDNESNATDMILYGVQFDDADTWLAELIKPGNKLVVQIDKDGSVGFFKQL
jgi:hypothetical protein